MAYKNHLSYNYKFTTTPQFSSQIPLRLQHYSDICIKTKSKNHSFQVNQRVVRNARGILDFFGTNVMSIPNRFNLVIFNLPNMKKGEEIQQFYTGCSNGNYKDNLSNCSTD